MIAWRSRGMTGDNRKPDAPSSCPSIAREFPGWHPWVSNGGRLWATRKGGQPGDLPEGWAMTVDADDAEGLRATISKQEMLASPVGRDGRDTNGRRACAVRDKATADRSLAGCQGMEGGDSVPTVLACPACRTALLARWADPLCLTCMKASQEMPSRPCGCLTRRCCGRRWRR